MKYPVEQLRQELFSRYPILNECKKSIDEALTLMIGAYREGGTVYTCGNGGSSADSDHIVGELMKGFRLRRPVTDDGLDTSVFADDAEKEDFLGKLQGALPAVSLTAQTAILSAFNNDVDPALCYAQLAYGYGRKNDLLIGISTSGNSQNVVNAVLAAKLRGMKTVALTGKKESRLSALCDATVRVPESETFKIQELHLPVYHYLCAAVESTFFDE